MQTKFYRPGKLTQKGTKLSLKTQPYVNGIIFDLKDPITSFHSHLSSLALALNAYEFLSEIPGVKNIDGVELLQPEEVGKLKLLLQYLTLSPIEIILKEQVLDQETLDAVQAGETYERTR